ncbi:MAG: hypothetical protein IPM29_20445 [Planctomycetes bacterium]|nr:hypothetical protein [Planctomycetota bacterium]
MTLEGDSERDQRGPFRRGNRGGPGKPHPRRAAEDQRAIREAIAPADLARVLVALRDLALDAAASGADRIAAARALLDRVAGRPREAAAPIDVDTRWLQAHGCLSGRGSVVKAGPTQSG